MKKLTVLLALLPLMLYPSGFWICELFFENDIDRWRLLRDTLKGVEIFALCGLNLLPRNKVSKAAMYSLLCLCVGNLVDRFIFGVHEFNWTDIVLLVGALAVFIIKLKGHERIFRGNRKPLH